MMSRGSIPGNDPSFLVPSNVEDQRPTYYVTLAFVLVNLHDGIRVCKDGWRQ